MGLIIAKNVRGKRARGAGPVIPEHFRTAPTQVRRRNELGGWSGGLWL
jgi:hypothetical protein